MAANERVERVFNAYELTYTVAIFSTVNVVVIVEAAYSGWRVSLGEGSGALITTFRPELPGIYRLVVTNQEPVAGQVGITIEQFSTLPVELESALLNPLLLGAMILLGAGVLIVVLSQRVKQRTTA